MILTIKEETKKVSSWEDLEVGTFFKATDGYVHLVGDSSGEPCLLYWGDEGVGPYVYVTGGADIEVDRILKPEELRFSE